MIKKGFHKNIKKAAAWTLTAVMAASLAGFRRREQRSRRKYPVGRKQICGYADH